MLVALGVSDAPDAGGTLLAVEEKAGEPGSFELFGSSASTFVWLERRLKRIKAPMISVASVNFFIGSFPLEVYFATIFFLVLFVTIASSYEMSMKDV